MSRLRRAFPLLLPGALATSMVVGANVTSSAQPAADYNAAMTMHLGDIVD